jgi:hypothetical protein
MVFSNNIQGAVMEHPLGFTLAGLLIAGILLYVLGQIRKVRYYRILRGDLQRRENLGERSVCRWFVDSSGNWGRVEPALK